MKSIQISNPKPLPVSTDEPTATIMVGQFYYGTEGLLNINGAQDNFIIDHNERIDDVDTMIIKMNASQYAEFMHMVFTAGLSCFGQTVLDIFNGKHSTEIVSMVEEECLKDG